MLKIVTRFRDIIPATDPHLRQEHPLYKDKFTVAFVFQAFYHIPRPLYFQEDPAGRLTTVSDEKTTR